VGLFPYSLFVWALATNKHFEPTVRIQTDRGHKVCMEGPYKFIRHPGYSGMILLAPFIPIFLGSWISYIPTVIAMATMTLRTHLEDKTLMNELKGYEEYSKQVKYRLIPLIW
jgi:protein-S-isoprenylcysteine O-methyltransferase Ste14